MTETEANRLAKLSRSYRARKLRGKWCVWCDKSDHVVEFDQPLTSQPINDWPPRLSDEWKAYVADAISKPLSKRTAAEKAEIKWAMENDGSERC